nr:CDP-glycerol glycerophosphotransferase family protein [Thalassotalea sp. G2M2-11]
MFYISQNYSFEILRPLQQQIHAQNNQVYWFVAGNDVDRTNFKANELVFSTVDEVVAYKPDACFVPGNIIPNFIPGIKVQVFHGLEWKKKGHFVIRDCFDLYCTHGVATTSRFKQLSLQHQFFDVIETGWPKLDNLFTATAKQFFQNTKPTILYAPTFSPSLTSAKVLHQQIASLIEQEQYNWLIKFHPKMNTDWIAQYQSLASDHCQIIDSDNINELLVYADIMISDTSSVIGEFSLLDKPVITFRNSDPGDYLIDITYAEQLPEAINQALSPSDELKQAINRYAQELHPYQDGQSSQRILAAVEKLLMGQKEATKPLPRNLFRNLKQRKKLGYWRF